MSYLTPTVIRIASGSESASCTPCGPRGAGDDGDLPVYFSREYSRIGNHYFCNPEIR